MQQTMTVCSLQHVACETPGLIADVLAGRGLRLEIIRPFLGEPVPPALERYDGLVVMGGPMGVYEQDRYPFLTAELRLIEQALRLGKPVLGVCLGSQLLASALGAPVTRGPRPEIGWFPVTLTPEAAGMAAWHQVPPSFTALHWHGDVFALPAGAVPLASSALTPCQGFAYGPSALGILFHLEVTPEIVAGMVATFAEELRQAGADGRQILADSSRWLPALGAVGRTVFDAWARRVKPSESG